MEPLLPSVQVVWSDIGRQLVGVAIQGKPSLSYAIGAAANRAADIRWVCEIV